MSYNLSFMNTSNNLYDIVNGVNSTAGGYLIGMFLVVLWLLIANYAEYSVVKSGVLASFITSIVAMLLSFAQLLSWDYVMWPVGLFLIMLVIYFFTE